MHKKKYNKENHYWIMLYKTKKFYRQIKSLRCPTLNNEEVFFTNSGFNHFFERRRFPRPRNDQLRRFYLFKHVVEVLQSTTAIITVRQKESLCFWTIKEIVQEKTIRVIVRQINNGPKHFFSIMTEKTTKKSPARENL